MHPSTTKAPVVSQRRMWSVLTWLAVITFCCWSEVHGDEVTDESSRREIMTREAREWKLTTDDLNSLLRSAYRARLDINETLARVDGCGPETVMDDCLSAVALDRAGPGSPGDRTRFADLDKTNFTTGNGPDVHRARCPARNGHFPVPGHRRKFFRCRGDGYTVEECETAYAFDPVKRYCILEPEDLSPTEEDLRALLPDAPQIATGTGTADPSGGDATAAAARGAWLCTTDVPGSEWDTSRAGVGQCWAEAVRRRARFLVVGTAGCQYRNSSAGLKAAACSGTAHHVISVPFFQADLARLRSGAKHWITGMEATGVAWTTIGGFPKSVVSLPSCSRSCMERGAYYIRVDYRGCRCGLAAGPAGEIRHGRLSWGSEPPPAAVDPGLTLLLRLRVPAGGTCAPGAAASLVEDSSAFRDTARFCRRRASQLRAGSGAGQRHQFHCAANQVRMKRAELSQCEMAPSAPVRLLSLKGFRVSSERIVSHSNSYVRDFRFWRVSEIPKAVVWVSPDYAMTLPDCMMKCLQRFAIVGSETCLCGSLPRINATWNVQEWVDAQQRIPLSPGEGFLFHDSDAFVNAPEGWDCSTKPPSSWQKRAAKTFHDCLDTCHNNSKAFAAFGRGGCLCGDAGAHDADFRSLPMKRCGTEGDTDAYSVLSVGVWRRNFASVRSQKGFDPMWVEARPRGVSWRPEPGRTTLADCLVTCMDRPGVKFTLLGIDGCECGSLKTGGDVTVGRWRSDSVQGKPAQGYFFVESQNASSGFQARTFKWKHDVREAVFRNTTGGSVNQTWASGPADGEMVRNVTQNITFNGENTDSKERHIERTVSVTGQNITLTANCRSNLKMAKTFLTGAEKFLNRRTVAENASCSSVTEYPDKPRFPTTYRRITNRKLAHTQVLARDSGMQSWVARAVLDGGHETRKIASKEFHGPVFLIKPAVNGTCYSGAANKTAWKSAPVNTTTPLGCLCHCLNKEQLFVAVLEGGRCFCGLNSEQLGNETGEVASMAACPADSVRIAFSVTEYIKSLMKYCKHAKDMESSAIKIGDTGHGHCLHMTVFHNRGIRRMITSEDEFAAMHTSRSVLNRAAAMHKKHGKNGRMAMGRWASLWQGPLPRMFHLELVLRQSVRYKEVLFTRKDERIEMREYKRVSLFQ